MSSSARFIALFFALCLLLCLLIDGLYRYRRASFITTPLEYKVKRLLQAQRDKDFSAVLFGTSVTYGALREVKLGESLLDLGSTGGTGFVGELFMLERFFKSGNRTKKVLIFMLPSTLANVDVSEDIFSAPLERREISRLKAALRGSSFPRKAALISPSAPYYQEYLSERIEYLKFWNYTYRDMKRYALDESKSGGVESNFDSTKMDSKTEQKLATKSHSATPKNTFSWPAPDPIALAYLDRLHALLQGYKASLTLVIEPLSPSHLAALNSNTAVLATLEKLQKSGISVLNSNDFHHFEAGNFYDGIHLREKYKRIYLKIIDEKIVRLD